MKKKTFNEKLNDSKDMPKVLEIEDPKTRSIHGKKMVIAPPKEYDDIIRRVPQGRLITSDEIRKYVANKYNADFTCPLTSGIFTSIVAHASEERGNDPTPWWRVLKKDGILSDKFPYGPEKQKILLENEGHTVIKRGKNFLVADLADSLYVLKD